jgi:hypothetical protein
MVADIDVFGKACEVAMAAGEEELLARAVHAMLGVAESVTGN